MNVALIRKLMISIVSLTTYFLLFIGVFNRDMRRPLSRSVLQFIPGIVLGVVGVFLSRFIMDPDFFKSILIIKSGFARKIIGSTLVPLIGNAMYSMGVIAGQIAIIDKLVFFLKNRRLPYIFALISIAGLSTIAAATLVVTIVGSQPLIIKTAEQMGDVGYTAGIILAIIEGILIIGNVMRLVKSRMQ